MTTSTALIDTPKASGFLQQLCKHFGHKVPAEFTEDQGRITFEMGTATLTAQGEQLRMTVEGADDAATIRLEEIMGGHLERFAFREELKVAWSRAA